MKDLGLIIFDMDGTLIDSMKQYTDAFCIVLEQTYGIDPSLSKEVFHNTAGLPLDQQFQTVISKEKALSKNDINLLIDKFWKHVQNIDMHFMPNADQVVHKLALAGYIMVITSSSIPSVVEYRMKQKGIDHYFKLLLGTDYSSTIMVKGTGHFNIIQHELSITKLDFRNNSVLVGDGPHDITIAKQARIKSISIANSENSVKFKDMGANIIIFNILELIDVLSKVEKGNRVYIPVSQLSKFNKTR